jgi:hypothetical protein
VTGTKLFISHAANDKPLVEAFVDLLEGGIGVSPRDIFCSSLKGQGIRPGADFKSSIRDHLDEATCVIAMISPSFYGSAFCMCELGGVWLQAKSLLPVLVPPIQFSDLKAILAGLQAGQLKERADLDELRDELAQRLSISPLPTPRWNTRRDAFLKSLPKLLKQTFRSAPISSDEGTKLQKQLDDLQRRYSDLEHASATCDKELQAARTVISTSPASLARHTETCSRNETMSKGLSHIDRSYSGPSTN